MLFYFLMLLGTPQLFAQAPCPAWGGQPKGSRLGNLNVAKNRSVVKPARKPMEVPLSDLLGNFSTPDSARYKNGTYVYTSGIVVFPPEERGPESCNCNQATKKTGDMHIYIGLNPDDEKEDCVVVEITPAYKLKHPDYATTVAKGMHVKVTGFILYDFEHKGNAKNTCKSCSNVWRKTCWEIHPVTDIREE